MSKGGEPKKPAQSEQPPLDQALILDAVRDEVQKNMPPAMQGMAMKVAIGSGQQAFIDKLSPDHVDKVLDYTKNDKTQAHWRFLTVFLVGVVAFLILCGMFLFANKDEILKQLVTAFIAFLGGFGIGKWSDK